MEDKTEQNGTKGNISGKCMKVVKQAKQSGQLRLGQPVECGKGRRYGPVLGQPSSLRPYWEQTRTKEV